MKKSKRKLDPTILNIIGVLCVYIIISTVFTIFRIPFSFLDEKTTDVFNDVTKDLAVSYLSGVFVYYLTIVRNRKKERQRRIFEIGDVFADLQDSVCSLEEEIGVRLSCAELADYEDYYSKEVHEKFCGLLNRYWERIILYKDILTQEEQNKIFEIRKMYKKFEPFDAQMSDEMKTSNWATIKAICRLIVELNNSVNEEIQGR